MRSLLFLSAFLLTVALSCAAGWRSQPALGGWNPIKNLTDPQVQEIAKFAVTENNKQTNSVLKLSRVVSGETQVVSGLKYRLVIQAYGGGGGGRTAAKYQAVVWDKPWEKSRKLLSFQQV